MDKKGDMEDEKDMESDAPTKNIVEIATSEDGFMMLATAITQAGLVDALSGEGPFTVFAPNDDAINALGQERLTQLLAAPERLTDILKYHVVEGKVMAADVAAGEVETLNGAKIKIAIEEGKVKLNDAATV